MNESIATEDVLYDESFIRMGFQIQEDDYYFMVGAPTQLQGWILHLTCIPQQIDELFASLLPVLKKYQVPFKCVKSRSIHHLVNSGKMGFGKIGKVFTIYPEIVERQLLVLEINAVTKDIRGPVVLTDFKIGNALYTRYGGFQRRLTVDPYGYRHPTIQTPAGGLLYDKYYQPADVPPWERFPFELVVTTDRRAERKFFIHKKYLLYKSLKSDIKGNVFQCAYLGRFFLPAFCVIKQGRESIHADEMGRDMRAMLSWQHKLNQEIYGVINVPRPVDFFIEEGQVCMVNEFVPGTALVYYSNSLLDGVIWSRAKEKVRATLLECLLEISEQIEKLHCLGYIHRDVTGSNFLIAAGPKVYLIDMELTYSTVQSFPDPPFGGGTFGFTSPQQLINEPPAYTDDIYSFGALIIQTLSGGFDPFLLLEKNTARVAAKIDFISGSESLVQLILRCLSEYPESRPSLSEIQNTLRSERANSPVSNSITRRPTPELIEDAANRALHFLLGPSMVDQGLWYSAIDNEYDREVYPMGNKHILPALYRGVAGPIYVYQAAALAGCRIPSINPNITRSWGYLITEISERSDLYDKSLYYGTSGIALIMARTINNGEMSDSTKLLELMSVCVTPKFEQLNLLTGAAGIGLATIGCKLATDDSRFDGPLADIVATVCAQQQKDGSWLDPGETGQLEKVVGFGYGIAGIVYFLFEAANILRSQGALASAERGLAYLSQVMIKSKEFYSWADSDKTKVSSKWWCHGGPGISMTYLKAFECTGNGKYAAIADMALRRHPKEILYSNLTLCHGMPGLGEIYLEAYRVTSSEEWLDRAIWVGQALATLGFEHSQKDMYWLTEFSDFPTADLMVGNSGIIHFLIRLLKPNILPFPGLPFIGKKEMPK